MSRKRLIWIGAIVAALAVIAGIAFSMRGQVAYANIAVGYAAKETCSCLNVSGRSLDSCLADFPEDARSNINVKVDGAHVSASVLGVIKSEAVYEEGFGCRIVN